MGFTKKVLEIDKMSSKYKVPFTIVAFGFAFGWTYTGGGTYATYEDGTPVHMKMDLSFTELNPIYAEDHDNVGGVGY